MGEIEYLAGFFDGEGSVGIYTNGRGLFHLRTQLTQNVGKHSTRLADMLVARFGGHYSMNLTLSGYTNFNWQLSSTPALRFLERIEPRLLLKKEQVRIAIGWQRQRPLPSRDEKGRMRKYAVDHAFDERVSRLVKALKKNRLGPAARGGPFALGPPREIARPTFSPGRILPAGTRGSLQ